MENGIRGWVGREPCQRTRPRTAHDGCPRPSATAASHAFDGCCVYDESARNGYSGYGVLAFLIAGNAALALANVSDQRIEQMCLDALPAQLAHGKELLLDRRIHRWMASVNAIPGGSPARSRAINHCPDPERLPGFMMVGDYMFDATLNGVLDSADAATDLILSDVLRRRRAQPQREVVGAGSPMGSVHGELNLALEQVEDLMSAPAVAGILAATWGLGRGAKLLHVGSGAGHMVAGCGRSASTPRGWRGIARHASRRRPS